MPELEFVTVEDVAADQGLTVRAVNHAIERGEFPNARKVSPGKETSQWLIPISDFKAYKQKRAQASKA